MQIINKNSPLNFMIFKGHILISFGRLRLPLLRTLLHWMSVRQIDLLTDSDEFVIDLLQFCLTYNNTLTI